MTFDDWVQETRHRFRSLPLHRATLESVNALRMGAQRRLGNVVGHPIWARGDWDVLLVLDACRVDLWNEVAPAYDLPQTNGVWSNASCSIDWIEDTFGNYPEESARTGYVTANAFVDHDAPNAKSADLGSDHFAHLARLFRDHWGPISDDKAAIETVPPAPVTDHAITAWRQRDQLGMDRMVVHYMQPHQPYRSRPDWVDIGKNLKNLVNNRELPGACAWQRCRRGEIDPDELWAAYRDNLEWVLDDVTERLLDNCDSTVAITADHGNAMGEWGEWAHPPGALSPAVRKVPWITVESADHRTATPRVDVRETGSQIDDTAERLSALGYAE